MGSIPKTLFKALFWVFGVGYILSRVIACPEIFSEVHPILWVMLLGCIAGLTLKPAIRLVYIAVKNCKAMWNAAHIVPFSKEEAAERGIHTPLDFCVFMSSFQVVPIMHFFSDDSLWVMTKGNFSVTQNKLFKTMFGRAPVSFFDKLTQKDASGWNMQFQGSTKVSCKDVKELWSLCVPAELALVSGKDPESLTTEDLMQYLSEDFAKHISMQPGPLMQRSVKRGDKP